MSDELSPELLQALRKINADSNIIIDIFDIKKLVTGEYATFTALAGWVVLAKGKEYLRKHNDNNEFV